jgi:hypothetical protein
MEMAAKNDAVRRLNQHPLNQAALVLLRQAGTGPQSRGSLARMHLLSLASLALPGYDSSAENEHAWSKFANWTWSAQCVPRWRRFEGDLDPDELRDMPLHEASEYIWASLE